MSDMRKHKVKAAYDEKRQRLRYELLMHRPAKAQVPERKAGPPKQPKRSKPSKPSKPWWW